MTKQVVPPSQGREADPLAIRERVFAEAKRFRERLPALLPIYRDQWVVFRDGEVVTVHGTEDEAYVAGLERFGPDGGHVVAAVCEPEIVVLSGITTLGL